MRVKVTPETILEYGLDTITGNPAVDLLARARELEIEGFELFVNIPDVAGGDTEAPAERNTFEHYSEVPDPEGSSHLQEALDLRDQQYIENPCSYKPDSDVDWQWYCILHNKPSKHAVDADSHAPCLEVDP